MTEYESKLMLGKIDTGVVYHIQDIEVTKSHRHIEQLFPLTSGMIMLVRICKTLDSGLS